MKSDLSDVSMKGVQKDSNLKRVYGPMGLHIKKYCLSCAVILIAVRALRAKQDSMLTCIFIKALNHIDVLSQTAAKPLRKNLT